MSCLVLSTLILPPGLSINDQGLLIDEKSGKVINEFGATRFDVAVTAMRGMLDPPAWVEVGAAGWSQNICSVQQQQQQPVSVVVAIEDQITLTVDADCCLWLVAGLKGDCPCRHNLLVTCCIYSAYLKAHGNQCPPTVMLGCTSCRETHASGGTCSAWQGRH